MANDNLDDMLDRALGLKPNHMVSSSSDSNDKKNIEDKIKALLDVIAKEKEAVMPDATAPNNTTQVLEDKLKKLLMLISQNNETPNPRSKSEPTTPNVVVNLSQNVAPQTKSNIACESCGSTAIQILNDTFGMCKHCGAKVIIKKPVNTPPVKINIVNNKAEIDSPYYVMKTYYDEAEFKRKSLIHLASIKDTPSNILDSEFEEVYINYPQFMFCTIHVDGSYSASIGYDRKEQYEAYENKWDPDLKKNIRQRVIKERTVTDWRPYSGTVSTNETVSVGIKGPFAHGADEYFDDLVASCNLEVDATEFTESGLAMEFASPSASASEAVINKAKSKAMGQVRFPGDHVKEVRSNFSHQILDTKFCIAPEYVMPYKIGNENFEARSFTTRFEPMGSFPSIEKRVTKNADKQSRKYGLMSILLSLFSMGLAVAFPFIVMNVFGIVLGILSMIPSIIGYILYKKLRAKKEKSIYQMLLGTKLSNLENYLTDNGMAPLTAEERALFEVK